VLENSFIPHILATGLPIHTQWFIQDAARPHAANVVLDFLYETFNLRVISHRFPELHDVGKLWPPHSPDMRFLFMGILERESVSKEARKCSAAQGPHSEVVPRAF